MWLWAVYWIRGYGLFTGYVVTGCLLGTWLGAVYWVRGYGLFIGYVVKGCLLESDFAKLLQIG